MPAAVLSREFCSGVAAAPLDGGPTLPGGAVVLGGLLLLVRRQAPLGGGFALEAVFPVGR